MFFMVSLNFKLVRSLVFLLVFFLLLCMGGLTYADEIEVHKADQTSLNALMRRLNISHADMKKSNKKREDKFSKFLDIKDRYYYKDVSRKDFWFVTDFDNRILALKISWTELDDLKEVSKFSRIKSLEINSNKFQNLEGISSLKDIIYLNVVGNDLLADLGEIHDLPVLSEIDAKTLKNVSIKGMKNLPKLESFLCGSCTVDDINPLANFKNLKLLKMGMRQETLNPLKTLVNVQNLMVNGERLTDISAIRNMPKLKSLEIKNGLFNELLLDESTPELEYIRIADSKVEKLPDFKIFKKLEFLTLTGTDVSEVSTIQDLPALETLRFARNLKMKKITNLENLPLLKELKAYKGPVEKFETGYLPSLEELTLSENNLTKLSGFENFPKLRRLILNETKVKSLKGIEKAPSLHWVQTDYEVKEDPENIKVLRQLRENRYKR